MPSPPPIAVGSRRQSHHGPRAAATSGSRVWQSSTYREAVQHYKSQDYKGALALLDRLDTPALPDADRAFLERQRALCQAALHPEAATKTQTRVQRVPVRARTASASDIASVDSSNASDCGPRALLLVCQKLGLSADVSRLCQAAGTTKDGTTLEGLSRAAASVGLVGKGVQMDRDALAHLATPALAWENGNHYIAVLGVHQRFLDGTAVATIHDPNHSEEEEIRQAELLSRSGGILLTLKKR